MLISLVIGFAIFFSNLGFFFGVLFAQSKGDLDFTALSAYLGYAMTLLFAGSIFIAWNNRIDQTFLNQRKKLSALLNLVTNQTADDPLRTDTLVASVDSETREVLSGDKLDLK